MKSKCCCCSLRIGSLICGWILMMWYFGCFVFGLYSMVDYIQAGCYVTVENQLELTRSQLDNYCTAFFSLNIVLFVMSIFYFISFIVLFQFGRPKPRLILLIIVDIPINIFIKLAFIITFSIILGFLHPQSIISNIILGLVDIFELSAWFCIYPYFQEELKTQENDKANEL